MKDKTQYIQNALEYTETMLEDAEVGDWDKVIAMEKKRSELIEKLFMEPFGGDNVADINKEIGKILFINKRLETIAVNKKHNIGNDVTSVNKGRQVVNLYKQNIL